MTLRLVLTVDSIIGDAEMLDEVYTPLGKVWLRNRNIEDSWGAFSSDLDPVGGIKREVPRAFSVAHLVADLNPASLL